MIISQILQLMRLDIACKVVVAPFEVSIGLLVEYAPRYAHEGRNPVNIFVKRGRELGFIRPSHRTCIHAPNIPDVAILSAPPSLALTRTSRYANRKCHTPTQRLKSELIETDGSASSPLRRPVVRFVEHSVPMLYPRREGSRKVLRARRQGKPGIGSAVGRIGTDWPYDVARRQRVPWGLSSSM